MNQGKTMICTRNDSCSIVLLLRIIENVVLLIAIDRFPTISVVAVHAHVNFVFDLRQSFDDDDVFPLLMLLQCFWVW